LAKSVRDLCGEHGMQDSVQLEKGTGLGSQSIGGL